MADQFYEQQLQPEKFQQACRAQGYPATVNLRPNYDHSYYFITTFIEDHIKHHANILKQ